MLIRFLPLLGALALAACDTTGTSLPVSDIRSTDSWVTARGFQPLLLPKTGYGPGSLVTSEKGYGFTEPLRLRYICAPNYTHAPAPQIDMAASLAAQRTFGGKLNVGVDTLGLGAAANSVSAVTVRFDNVVVEELSEEDLVAIRRGLGPDCKELLKKYKKAGIARQTNKAVRADVVYTAELKQGASADVKNLVAKALKASFGGSVTNESETSVTGKGLYYGVDLLSVD